MPYEYGTEAWEKAYEKLTEERLKSEAKPYRLGTPEFCFECQKAINDNSEYAKLSKGLAATDILVILAEPVAGLDEDLYLSIRLEGGGCPCLRLIPRDEAEKVGDIKENLTITGTYEQWKSVFRGELDILNALVGRKMNMKGSLPLVMKYTKASKKLIDIVGSVNPVFPDELDPDELEKFRAHVNEIRGEFGV
jgi:putative sterol carrier protein